jgi:hypothetical protein
MKINLTVLKTKLVAVQFNESTVFTLGSIQFGVCQTTDGKLSEINSNLIYALLSTEVYRNASSKINLKSDYFNSR